MKMKANNNNDITDYYLALFSSINCATATANRNKKSRSIEVNNNNISLNSSKCLIYAPDASLRLISKCVSAEWALSVPIGTNTNVELYLNFGCPQLIFKLKFIP